MPEAGQPNGETSNGNTSQSGATPGTTGPTSQGPNDPINPPNGGQPGTATGTEAGSNTEDRSQTNYREAMSRMAAERDTARRELEDEKRKSLTPEELARFRQQDEKDKQRDVREKNLILRYEIAARAPRLGIVDPETAVLLLERNQAVAVADDGSVTGLDEALKALIKEKPFLVKATTQPVDGGAGTGGARAGNKPGMNDIIRGAARGRVVQIEE